MIKNRLIAAAFVASVLAGQASSAAAQECFSFRAGRQFVEQGLVVPLPEAMRRAGLRRNQLVNVQLCRAGGGFVYRLRVIGPAGRLRWLELPAG